MERRKFLRLFGIGVASIPVLGLPKDDAGFYIDKPAKPPLVLDKPFVPVPKKPATFEEQMLQTIFENQDLGLGKGNLYVGLYTEEYTDVSNSVLPSYKDYKRVAVPRNSENWEITESGAKNKKKITFPECTSGAARIDGFLIESDEGVILKHPLSDPVYVSSGITPEFAPGGLNIVIDMD